MVNVTFLCLMIMWVFLFGTYSNVSLGLDGFNWSMLKLYKKFKFYFYGKKINIKKLKSFIYSQTNFKFVSFH